jgi:hypothetical protein
MINENELRIGNSITFDGYDAKITGISEGFYEDDKFQPITLNEEWLQMFGFNYEETLIYGKSGWFKKLEKQDHPTFLFFNNHLQCSILISSEKSTVNHFIDINTEYVHQLQNLYFTLTGKELDIL